MILEGIKALFGTTKVADTAVDFVRKIGGLDELSAKEKLDAAMQYMQATKHQSPTRRLIAKLFVCGFMLFTFVWLVATIAFRLNAGLGGPEILTEQLNLLSGDLFAMIKELLSQPLNLVLIFYFTLGAGILNGKQ